MRQRNLSMEGAAAANPTRTATMRFLCTGGWHFGLWRHFPCRQYRKKPLYAIWVDWRLKELFFKNTFQLSIRNHCGTPSVSWACGSISTTRTGLNSFVLTHKIWVEQTGAKGIVTKQGRYATTFAHQDIAPGGFSIQRKNTCTAKLV